MWVQSPHIFHIQALNLRMGIEEGSFPEEGLWDISIFVMIDFFFLLLEFINIL